MQNNYNIEFHTEEISFVYKEKLNTTRNLLRLSKMLEYNLSTSAMRSRLGSVRKENLVQNIP